MVDGDRVINVLNNEDFDLRPYKTGAMDDLIERVPVGQMKEFMHSNRLSPQLEADNAQIGIYQGVPVCLFAIHEIWPGRAFFLFMVSTDISECMLGMTRMINTQLDMAQFDYRRIECTLEARLSPLMAPLMKMLGFRQEGYLKAYNADGSDSVVIARIRK